MKAKDLGIVLWLAAAGIVPATDQPVQVTAELIAAAERGEPEAQLKMAKAYLLGEGVTKDPRKALEFTRKAADQGNADAMGAVGYFYSTGSGVEKDDRLAAEWFRKGAEKGSAKAQLNLGKVMLYGKAAGAGDSKETRAEGLEWFRKAADQGLAEAAVSYGSFLFFGDEHGVTKDHGRASQYFEIAADQGNADAQNFLGAIHESRAARTQQAEDRELAEGCFRKAALQGHVKAQTNLGRIMAGPLATTPERRIESLAWLMLAARGGEVPAQKLLEDFNPSTDPLDAAAAQRKSLELQTNLPTPEPGHRSRRRGAP